MRSPDESRRPPGPQGSHGPLTPERWARVRALVEEAIGLPPEARPAFLDASCGDDGALRDRVARLAAACDRAEGSWGFLARPAGEIAAPLLGADEGPATGAPPPSTGPPSALAAALADRYAVGPELGRGGMATVYVADDLRHHRRVALKVLDPRLGQMLGAERFLAEIRVTAGLQHPGVLPLFDSGEVPTGHADSERREGERPGLLYYVMPLVEGGTLRGRLQREGQLPVEEALALARAVAEALDYAHRRGIVHRDVKPENILLHDGHPLLADFGIAKAIATAADPGLTATGFSLGTPRYMSPEQAAGSAMLDGRSDIYSLATVLYEMLAGDPPFTGASAQAVIAKVIGDPPSSVRTVRPAVPPRVDIALTRALAKLPADRHATAGEFAAALAGAGAAAVPPALAPTSPARRRRSLPLLAGAALTVAAAGAAWAAWGAYRRPAAAAPTVISYRDLIDRSLVAGVGIAPNGRALVYTGAADRGRPLMLWRLDQRAPLALAGTEGGSFPSVSPSGRRLAYASGAGGLATMAIDGLEMEDAARAWRYGSGVWIGDSAVVIDGTRTLVRHSPGGAPAVPLTRLDSARAETRHAGPLVLPGGRAVVFTVSTRAGPGLAVGPLAIASLEARGHSLWPHVVLGVTARRAIALVDEWLLYTRADGRAIMAVRLDVERRQTIGDPIVVREDAEGDLVTGALADNGTLLYVRRARRNAVVFVDTAGAARPGPATAEGSYMHPRLSPDGRRFVVQVSTALGEDLWIYDLASRAPGVPRRLTTSGQALHPAWTPDGRRIVFLRSARRGLGYLPADGSAPADTIAGTEGAFAPAAAPDNETVVFHRRTDSRSTIWSARLDGASAPVMLVDDGAVASMPAVSPDGRWLAYVSTVGGREEVYARALPGPGPAVQVSDSGGTEPSWSSDGRHIYYRARAALMAAETAPAPGGTPPRRRFADFYDATMKHRNYDVSRDGRTFLMIAPSTAANPEVVLVLDFLTELRARLANARANR